MSLSRKAKDVSANQYDQRSKFASKNRSKTTSAKGVFGWLHDGRTQKPGLALINLCNVVASETMSNTELAEKALVLILTSGFARPDSILRAVNKEMKTDYQFVPVAFNGANFECRPDANADAKKTTDDLNRIQRACLRDLLSGRPCAFTYGQRVVKGGIAHDEVLASVCTYVFGLAIKAVTNSTAAADNLMKRVGHDLQRKNGGGSVAEKYEMSREFCTAVVLLIQKSFMVRYLLVHMYLSLSTAGGHGWIRMVCKLGRFIEESGISIYTQIRDHFVIPGAAPLLYAVFTKDLMAFEIAVEHADRLGPAAPFVRFLELPEACHFEAGRFPALIPFMKGYFEVVSPINNQLMVSSAYASPRLRKLGQIWGSLVMTRQTAVGRQMISHGSDDDEVLEIMRKKMGKKRGEPDTDTDSDSTSDSDA